MFSFLKAVLVVICFDLPASAQTIGGSSVFSFLKFSNSPQLSALGGINASNISDDISLSFQNPALLRESMSSELGLAFTSLYAGINSYHLIGAYHLPQIQTTFSGGVQYMDYGSIPQTDAAGNVLGTFRPGDYVIQVAASRKYLEHFNYGVTAKYVSSNYGLYRSTGVALDVGVAYLDSAKLFQVSLVMKNMGAQLKKYEGTAGDGLPFDLQLGLTKRLANAPLQFSVTAHHLHQLDLRYDDILYNSDNGFSNLSGGQLSFDNIFRHLVVACQFFATDKIEISAAYNHLRRSELNIQSAANGLNGFSLGVGAIFKKLQIRYARSYYEASRAYNHFGINLALKEFTYATGFVK